MKLRYRVENAARTVAEFFQDRWFDGSRRVHTAGNVSLGLAEIVAEEARDSELYVPARPRHIREALRATGIDSFAGYSYVDLGSGKGRTLFIAAELPFQEAIGVEFSPLLHEQACANIRSFRWWKRRCREIRSVHMNAKDFVFPESKLVLYMFNPFGPETMQPVLHHLEESLRARPRHVVIILLWPRCGDLVAQIEGMRLRRSTRRHEIFETELS